jgi:adenylate cyclase
VLHWDRRRSSEGTFRPSRKLVVDAVRRQRQSVVYMWSGGSADGSILSSLQTEGSDWAFCTPVRGAACKGWAVYVAGAYSNDSLLVPTEFRPSDLQDDVKFTEMVASILSSIRQIRVLERRHASLTQFFSPAVLSKFSEDDPEIALEPKQCEVSVLFCDLRGFSRESESHAHDLLQLLERVSRALGVMTSHILDEGGVVGDFQGDAAMGFWGWPIEQIDQSRRACLAALGIRAHFEASAKKADHPLRQFRVGIGVATGTAVAGKIGTTDQAKVGVFGPIVNMASRLEGLSKLLAAPVLLDEATARAARGLISAVEVSELLPPVSQFPELTDEHLTSYEAALDAFIAGDWGLSMEHLHKVPPVDRVKDFLTAFIVQNNRTPPPGWDGVIRITSKG